MPSNVRWEVLTVDGVDMDVFVDEPAAPGPHPAIVVAHHRAGNDAATTKFVQDLPGQWHPAPETFAEWFLPDGIQRKDLLPPTRESRDTKIKRKKNVRAGAKG